MEIMKAYDTKYSHLLFHAPSNPASLMEHSRIVLVLVMQEMQSCPAVAPTVKEKRLDDTD